jgi:hypothetical protein
MPERREFYKAIRADNEEKAFELSQRTDLRLANIDGDST